MRDEYRLAKLVAELLDELGTSGDEKTPLRVARTLKFFTRRREEPMPSLSLFPTKPGTLVIHRDMPFVSLCAHHMLPYWGRATVAYVSSGKVLGASKHARLLEWLAADLTIQEDLTYEYFSVLWQTIKPFAMLVHLKARHACMCFRGVRTRSVMHTHRIQFCNAKARERWQSVIEQMLVALLQNNEVGP